MDDVRQCVYADKGQMEHFDTYPTKALDELVDVDFKIHGCPINGNEFKQIVRSLLLGKTPVVPDYPVCVECKQRFTICALHLGQLCLGPITRGGCNAPCPAGGLVCLGCRGPAADPNYDEMLALAERHGFQEREIAERVNFFGAFEGII